MEDIDEEASDVSQDEATDATDLAALTEEDEELEEETEADESELSLVDKIKKKIQKLQKKPSKKKGSDDEDEEEVDDAEAAKKKKSKVVQIAIGAALVLFLLSDYIIPPEEPVPADGSEEIIGEDNGQRSEPVAETPVAETPVAETPVAETPVAETPVAETPVEETPVAETPVAETPVAETPVAEPSFTAGESGESGVISDFSVEEPSDSVSDIPIETTPGESSSDIVGEDMGQTGDESLTDQILLDLEKQTKGAVTEEPKKEYVAPPDYEYRGRGLVYNCVGKHWACVDGPSYKSCEDNASSVKYLNKKTECYPFNVYETTKGCESMQNRMVSSSAKTSFCSE